MRIENVQIFVYLLCNMWGTFIVANFLGHFFAVAKWAKKIIIPLYMVRFIIISFTYLTYNNVLYNISVNIVLYLILALFYDSKLTSKLIIIAYYYAIAIASELLAVVAFSIISRVTLESITQPSLLSILSVIFSRIILSMICLITTKIIRYKKYESISIWYWLATIVIPIGSMIMAYNIFSTQALKLAGAQLIETVIFTTLINFFVFFVYDKILDDYIIKAENSLLVKQIQYYDYQLELIQSSQRIVNKTRHDIEKHLLGMQINLQKGEADEAERTIASLLGKINSNDGPANSGNVDVDAIINYKSNYANTLGIKIISDLQIPISLQLNASDLAVILGNAIDNAIEASKKLISSEKNITVTAKYLQSNLYISICNPFQGQIKRDLNGEIITTKVNASSHGIGIKSISEIVARYNGCMDIEVENGKFMLNIALFNLKIDSAKKTTVTVL